MAETQTESKKSDTRRNKIAHFIISALDRDVMAKYIEENGIEIDTEDEDTTTEQIGVSLYSYFTSTIEEADLVRCETCEGIGPDTAKNCPYCGDSGEVEEEDEEVETKSSKKDEEEEPEAEEEEETEEEEAPKKKAKKDEPEEPESNTSIVDEDEEEEEEEAPKKKAEKDEDEEESEASDEEEEEDTDETETNGDDEETEEKVAKSAKKKETKMTTATESNGVSKKNKSLVTTKDLDKTIAKIVELKSEGAENYWRMGRELLKLNKESLWKLRTDDNGKPKYKTWDAFVFAELGMSVQHAWRAIECAKNYETPEEVRELGHTKAVLILQAAPEDRAKLKKKAKAGATKRELEKDVKESRQKHGSPKKDSPKAKAGAKGGAAKAAKTAARSEKVSVANIEGVKTIKLFAKPESFRGFGWGENEDEERAHSIKDQPVGRYELTNGVVQFFEVSVKDGDWVLKIQTKRGE